MSDADKQAACAARAAFPHQNRLEFICGEHSIDKSAVKFPNIAEALKSSGKDDLLISAIYIQIEEQVHRQWMTCLQ